MSDPMEDRRASRRLTVGPDHRVRFSAGGKVFSGISLSDLSAGGCCARIPVAQAEGLERGMALEDLHLAHPKLPGAALRGRLAWIMGRVPGRTEGFVVLGIEFVEPAAAVTQAIEAYVAEGLAQP